MKKILFAACFPALLAGPAHAYTNDTGYYDGLDFVSETTMSGPNESNMSLCYATRDLRVLGITLLSNVKDYALSDDGCTTTPIRVITQEEMTAAQLLGLIPEGLPPQARNSMQRNLQNYGFWAAVGLALIAVIIRRVKSLLGYDLRGPMRSKAASRVLMAMCHVGSASGVMASTDVALVNTTARRLTRRNYHTSDVVRVADQLNKDLTPDDYIAFGKGLRDHEKDTMMQGVLHVAMAPGRMLPDQYKFATELANGLGMPAEDFRRVMNIVLAELNRPPSADKAAAD